MGVYVHRLGNLLLLRSGLNGDFFLIGNPLDSFKKMVDVYETEKASIASNTKYLSVVENYRNSELFAFVDVSTAAPYLILLLSPVVAREVEAFETFGCSWEMLETGGKLRLFAQLKNGTKMSLISRFKMDEQLQTTQGLSGTEEISLTLAPSIAPLFWQVFLADLSGELGNFLFPSVTNWKDALRGELTLSLDFSNFFSRTVANSHALRYIVDKPDNTNIKVERIAHLAFVEALVQNFCVRRDGSHVETHQLLR